MKVTTQMHSRWHSYLTLLGVELLSYQQELANSLLSLPYTAKVTQCRQSGKSFIMGLIIYFLAYAKGWDIVITAPKMDQCWAIMRHVHKVQDKVRAKVLYDNRYSLSLRGRGTITCLSGSETAHVEGASAHLVVIDEHQDLPSDHAAETFLPMLSWHNGLYWSCGIGSPPHTVGDRGDVDFIWTLPYTDVVKVKPDYQRLVEQAKREMLPEQFASHYGCQPLDISAHLLIPAITPYDVRSWDKAHTTIGIDWGRRIDSSVATVVDTVGDRSYITGWLVPRGTYDEQLEQLTHWLTNDVEYDDVIAETNGVGDSATDVLISMMGNPGGFPPRIHGFNVDQSWKTEQAKTINRKATNGSLQYNRTHELAGVFLSDITSVSYKMLDSDHLKCEHSDFLSSLMLAMHTSGQAYL